MSVLKICDFCEKTITGKSYKVAVKHSLEPDDETIVLDSCEECYQKKFKSPIEGLLVRCGLKKKQEVEDGRE